MKTSSILDRFRLQLKSKNLKATPQRMAVHEAMLNLGHACAEDVVKWTRSSGTSRTISTASVYNILTQLAGMGIYSKRMSADSKMYFDITTDRHFHLYDSVNNTFRDLSDDEFLGTVVEAVESHFKHKKIRGYRMDYVDIQIVCHPSGRKRAQPKPPVPSSAKLK